MLQKLVKYIELHNFNAKIVNDELWVEELSSLNGECFTEWIQLNPTYKEVRNWLGY